MILNKNLNILFLIMQVGITPVLKLFLAKFDQTWSKKNGDLNAYIILLTLLPKVFYIRKKKKILLQKYTELLLLQTWKNSLTSSKKKV